jgi:hypothetical protein
VVKAAYRAPDAHGLEESLATQHSMQLPGTKIITPDGKVIYTDGSGVVRQDEPNASEGATEQGQELLSDEEERLLLKETVKQARKHGPKIVDYLNYIEYLRTHSPARFDRVMRELMETDRKTWVALQQSPRFRPLRDTLIGGKADAKFVQLAADFLMRGNITSGTAKFLETSLNEMMKKDRFGPYLDVLGSKASTLPRPKPTVYSNSKLGQYLKVEDARQAQKMRPKGWRLRRAPCVLAGAGL